MKMYIPQIGDTIQLTADWCFSLYNEDRNETLIRFIGDSRIDGMDNWRRTITAEPFTMPAGSKLKVDRIYIRKGQDDFSSITFFWVDKRIEPRFETVTWSSKPQKYPARPVRFWARLEDVNNIEFDAA
jgi:hypothetical protein